MTFESLLAASHPDVPIAAAETVVQLVAEGATPIFIARHRRARVAPLSETQIAAVVETKERFDALRERQRFVAEEIDRQGRLTPELRATIEATDDRDALDDLYLPFKRKRQTPGALAAAAGLEPLADWIWNCGHGIDTPHPGQTLALWAFTFRSEEHGIADADQAIAGAESILVERIAEIGSLRRRIRERLRADGWLHVARGDRFKDGGRFAAVADGVAPIATFLDAAGADRYLAIRRGVNEGEVRMRVAGAPDAAPLAPALCDIVIAEVCPDATSPGAEVLRRAAERAFSDHLWPAAETALHKTLRAAADDVALAELATGVRRLLLAAPFGRRSVLGIDPAPRGGSRIAIVDAQGTVVEHGVLHLDGEARRAKSADLLAALATQHAIEGVAVGDGVASKDAMRFVRGALRARGCLVPVMIASEAGLGAWAASEAAREELPAFDPGVRAAIGIARRAQDPLAELVKVEPRTLPVDPLVHDVSQPRLERALATATSTVVADLGVDVNAAGAGLLAWVPGLGPGLARAIVEYRQAHGPFATRQALRVMPLMDARTFEHVAGFLRVRSGTHPLDATAVHPERYELVERAAAAAGVALADLRRAPVPEAVGAVLAEALGGAAAADLQTALTAPDADPRGVLDPVPFHPDVRTLADLAPGLVCPGVVTNVTSFGAFVDIGLPHDGLVHVSRLADQFVQDPYAVVHVGDRVEVRVVDVHPDKQQISLSMKREAPSQDAPRPPRAKPRERPHDRGKPERPRPREQPAFNNPFASLSSELRGGTPTGRSKGRSS